MRRIFIDVKLIFYVAATSLLSLTSVNTHAQSKIFGLVTDIVGLPIADANVLLLNSKDSSLIKGSVSEKDGKYIFANISAGNYMVSSTFVGFKQVYTTPFNVGGNNQEINIPTIKFVEKEAQLAEVKVTAKKPLFEQKIDRMVVNVANSIRVQ
jgi:hypothetical protein